KDLFFSGEFGCNFCHTEITFTAAAFFNNGLDAEYSDQGRGAVTGNPADNGKFKTPSLRNIGLTAPYMHDARFKTLEEVVEHYNSGVQAHPNLDDRMSVDGETGGPPKQLNMTEEEKAALIAFLFTLTDEVLITDEKFSDPFNH
ncbi:MAG: cytochrome-c peroxidase, partial [Phaeodactylibacter sp.]|nr:cytochrome-c peroxidase [Phaeodactylibacter sp.]